MSRRFWEQYLAAGLALLTGVCCGCGTQEYQKRMAAGVEQIKQGSVFNELLYDPMELEGTHVSVRVPKVFKRSFKERSVIDGKPVDPRRVKPMVLDLAEMNITYEAMVPSAGGQVAYYCYLGARDLKGSKAADPGMSMAGEVRDKFPDTTGDWEEVQFPTPEGRGLAWKKLRGTGPQDFYYVDKAKQATFKRMPGTLEVYYRQDAASLVVMAWRLPTAVEKSSNFAQLAALVGGSISVKE